MKISALRFSNVKRFAARGIAIEGIGDGVNVLCAANEFGKSTSFEALHGLFFLPHSSTAADARNLRPYSGGNPVIEADVAVGDDRYRISKQYFGGRYAKVVDLATGRIVAQNDEAENFITRMTQGGTGGPAGLLWVRQGMTGIEARSSRDQESDRLVRTGLLESVQGEVEAMTGGRRMAGVIAAAGAELAALVTPTGRPKAGGRLADAIARKEELEAEAQRLEGEVKALHNELVARSAAQTRLAELEDADAREERRRDVAGAEAAFEAARTQTERLKSLEAELKLARERRDVSMRELKQVEEALADARQVADDVRAAGRRRDEASERRRMVDETIGLAQAEAEAAEAEETSLRELLGRIEASARSRAAAEQRAEGERRLEQAEAVCGTIEFCEAQLAGLRLPKGAVDELQELDIEIARIRAVREAGRPTVLVSYEHRDAPRVTMAGSDLVDGEERGFDTHTQLLAPGIGTITLRSTGVDKETGRLDEAEGRRRTLLASMGVTDLAAARAQEVRVQSLEGQAGEARAQRGVLAPNGLEALRKEVAALASIDLAPNDVTDDPNKTRAALEAAELRRRQAVQAIRAAEPARNTANDAVVASETQLAVLRTREEQIAAVLGPQDGREERYRSLDAAVAERESTLAKAQEAHDEQRAQTRDLAAADAALRRVRSVEQAAVAEAQQLRERIAGLTAHIVLKSDGAVEERWRETLEALEAATVRVGDFEREVAVMTRLTEALEAARTSARDLYLKPVMTELHPLLALLFEDATISFDDRTLLPQTITRQGQEENVDRLSGGMREQLSVLTRLAFARLLSRDGRPTPVILDDALVYSDDDRIERMFDALHRQADDQQIIVFSCRQRAFQKLGGNVLTTVDWVP
jgi:hypothetical protein